MQQNKPQRCRLLKLTRRRVRFAGCELVKQGRRLIRRLIARANSLSTVTIALEGRRQALRPWGLGS
jgi:hypothetical protein